MYELNTGDANFVLKNRSVRSTMPKICNENSRLINALCILKTGLIGMLIFGPLYGTHSSLKIAQRDCATVLGELQVWDCVWLTFMWQFRRVGPLTCWQRNNNQIKVNYLSPHTSWFLMSSLSPDTRIRGTTWCSCPSGSSCSPSCSRRGRSCGRRPPSRRGRLNCWNPRSRCRTGAAGITSFSQGAPRGRKSVASKL